MCWTGWSPYISPIGHEAQKAIWPLFLLTGTEVVAWGPRHQVTHPATIILPQTPSFLRPFSILALVLIYSGLTLAQ